MSAILPGNTQAQLVQALAVANGATAAPGDTEAISWKKMLVAVGGSPGYGDTIEDTLRKVVIAKGGDPNYGDGEINLVSELLVILGGAPAPGDRVIDMLDKILNLNPLPPIPAQPGSGGQLSVQENDNVSNIDEILITNDNGTLVDILPPPDSSIQANVDYVNDPANNLGYCSAELVDTGMGVGITVTLNASSDGLLRTMAWSYHYLGGDASDTQSVTETFV